jgi:hypothetical protein
MFKHAVLIGDSVTGGNNAISSYDKLFGYQLSKLSGVRLYDLSVSGSRVCRRPNFPKAAGSAGLRDKAITVNNVWGDTVTVMQGINDLQTSSIPKIISEFKYFSEYVMKDAGIPKTVVIVTPVSTVGELVSRPNVVDLRAGLVTMVAQLHAGFLAGKYVSDCKIIDGTLLSDCNNPANMDDGDHRSEAGHLDMAVNFYAKMQALGLWT